MVPKAKIDVKICGLNSAAAAKAAGDGAAMIGFVFYPPSPRAIKAKQAAELGELLPASVARVGLFVDPDDEKIEAVLKEASLDWLQLHGEETPERLEEIKKRFGLPLIKAVKIARAEDVARAEAFYPVADKILFDSRPPASLKGALPGGNALAFDWTLLSGFKSPLPWMLSGGLTVKNLGRAVAQSGARAVDVSSGVEDAPGVKNPAKIREFLEAAAKL